MSSQSKASIRRLVTLLLLLFTYPVLAQNRQSDFPAETFDFLSRLKEQWFERYVLLSPFTIPYRKSGGILQSAVKNQEWKNVIYKEGWSVLPGKKLDSIVLSEVEVANIVQSLHGRKRHRWAADLLPYNFYLLSQSQAKCVVNTNVILEQVSQKIKPIIECSRPYFFRGDSLAIFAWQKIDNDSYGQVGLYRKHAKVWELFGILYNHEGALKLESL